MQLNFHQGSKRPIQSILKLQIECHPTLCKLPINLDPLLLAAVIRQESTFRPYVSSPAGAVGLTQVMPRYWQATCPGDLYDELTNINCGSFILTKYKNAAGSIPKALAY